MSKERGVKKKELDMSRHAFLIPVLLLFPTTALAAAPWPGRDLGIIINPYGCALGVLVETLALMSVTERKFASAFALAIGLNLCSAVVGTLVIPYAGFAFDSLRILKPFSPLSWASNVVIASAVNLIVESISGRALFKVQLTSNFFFVMFIANIVSLGVATWFLRAQLSG